MGFGVVFFTPHLTHGAVLLQSLHFYVHYDEACQSNMLTFVPLDGSRGESILKTSIDFGF